jgi:hypothetical protein
MCALAMLVMHAVALPALRPQAGAELNTASAVHGHTPLDVAVQLQQDEHRRHIVQLLTSKGAQRANEDYKQGGNQEL